MVHISFPSANAYASPCAPASHHNPNAKICNKACSIPTPKPTPMQPIPSTDQVHPARRGAEMPCNPNLSKVRLTRRRKRRFAWSQSHGLICTSQPPAPQATFHTAFSLPQNFFGNTYRTIQAANLMPIPRPLLAVHSPFIKLQLQVHVLRALAAVIIREAAALDSRVLAHIDAPGIVRIAGEEA